MMLPFKTLFKGQFLSVVKPTNIPNYEIVHENNGVIVFPIFIGQNDSYTIVRKEFVPPYIMKTPEYTHYYTVISGTMDEDGESPEECMLRELQEETGVKPTSYDILWKQLNMPMYKGSDRRSNNYIIRIRDFEIHKEQPDGTTGEALSSSIPIRLGELKGIIQKPNCDFLLYSFAHLAFLEILRLKS